MYELNLFRDERKRQVVNEDERIDIGAARILVGGSNLISVLGHEVVVVGNKQKEILRVRRIERRHQRHAFPFLRQIITVVGLAVAQPDLVELGIVVDVDKEPQRCRRDDGNA